MSDINNLKGIDDIEVSTKTIIADTNIEINLNNFFKYIPITSYTPIEKKRGRKKKSIVEKEPQKLDEGSIITLQKGNEVRGIILKKKRIGSKTFFLHSVSVVMSIENNKFINIKVSNNGKLQITGCKNNDQCFKTILFLYKHIKNSESIIQDNIFQFKYNKIQTPDKNSSEEKTPSNNNDNQFEVKFDTVMQNMDYNIGFDISREKLNTFINNKTKFTSIYEGSIGTGVNIKIESRYPYEENLIKMNIKYNVEEMKEEVSYSYVINKEFIENELIYDEHYDEEEYEYTDDEMKQIKKIRENINKEDLIKKSKKEKYHTFLVFASGSIIMSSRGPLMKQVFSELLELLNENKEQIIEKTTVREN